MIPFFEIVAVAALLAAVAAILLRWPEAGTLVVMLLVYLNLPAIAVKLYGVPTPVVGLLGFLLVPPLLQNLFMRRERVILNMPFLLLFVFLGTAVASSFVAKDTDLALLWVTRYLAEGVLLYFLLLNLVRTFGTLRRVTWALLVAGAVLGSLTLYQEISHSYGNEFGGLAQRTLKRETPEDVLFSQYDSEGPAGKVRLAQRAQGPIDDPNRFAQMLIVLLPLGWCRVRDEPTFAGRALAGSLSILILSGVLITYSRGAFLALLAMLTVLAILRGIRLFQVVAVAAVLIVSAMLFAPGYSGRILTLRGVQGLFSASSDVDPDAVQRGRATEMLAAWNVLVDHPVLGVGPGQFAPIYSVSYMSEHYSLRRVTEQRRAHSLYLELGAEMGVVGLLAFLAVVVATLRDLMTVRRQSASHRAVANYATAFIVAISGYLTTALFLQLSFQRYFWILLSLAGAAVHAARSLDPRGERHQVGIQPIGDVHRVT